MIRTPVKGRARPKHVPGSMNKTEQAYDAHLKRLQMSGEIVHYQFEPIKLRLADKTFYTPDFLVVLPDGEMQLHEVKGYWEDDARVKIKVVAEQYPYFKFIAVKDKHKAWVFEDF